MIESARQQQTSLRRARECVLEVGAQVAQALDAPADRQEAPAGVARHAVEDEARQRGERDDGGIEFHQHIGQRPGSRAAAADRAAHAVEGAPVVERQALAQVRSDAAEFAHLARQPGARIVESPAQPTPVRRRPAHAPPLRISAGAARDDHRRAPGVARRIYTGCERRPAGALSRRALAVAPEQVQVRPRGRQVVPPAPVPAGRWPRSSYVDLPRRAPSSLSNAALHRDTRAPRLPTSQAAGSPRSRPGAHATAQENARDSPAAGGLVHTGDARHARSPAPRSRSTASSIAHAFLQRSRGPRRHRSTRAAGTRGWISAVELNDRASSAAGSPHHQVATTAAERSPAPARELRRNRTGVSIRAMEPSESTQHVAARIASTRPGMPSAVHAQREGRRNRRQSPQHRGLPQPDRVSATGSFPHGRPGPATSGRPSPRDGRRARIGLVYGPA